MIKIYGVGGARSRRVLWTCEEVGAAYEYVTLKMPTRVNHPEFLDISPAGALPAMEDGDFRMIESLAICEYIARKYSSNLVPGPGDAGYTDYLQYLSFGESTLAAPLTWIRRFGPDYGPAADLGREAFSQRLAVISRALSEGRTYLAGEILTLADISVGYTLGLARLFGEDALITPDVAAYEDRLKARPAYLRAYAA